jgi:hypothetical protein
MPSTAERALAIKRDKIKHRSDEKIIADDDDDQTLFVTLLCAVRLRIVRWVMCVYLQQMSFFFF